MNDLDKINMAMEILKKEYRCHTVILYGSHAKGTATVISDIDMAGFTDTTDCQKRHTGFLEETYLDLFIFPEGDLFKPDETKLHMRIGKVMCEKENLGKTFIEKLSEIYLKGPDPLSDDELEARKLWYQKMLERSKKSDPEGNYRMYWMLTSLLEDYFALRNLWYPGSKDAFLWLEENDMKNYELFETALKKDASIESIQKLVHSIVDM